MNGNSVVLDTNKVLSLRKATKLKLPDSIVLATARYLGLPLITSDADFKATGFPEIIIYE